MASDDSSSLPPRGMPILSGPPPVVESSSCRQCAKQFNPLWRRSHVCGHCGYEYCSTCLSDGQALMPRRPGQASSSNGPLSALREEFGIGSSKAVGGGYEVESVCLHCLSMLQVTAAPLPILRGLPLKRLKDYLAAYNISCVGPKEKEDFVQAVIKARDPTTGCLPAEAESYYRRKSVPKAPQSESGGSSNGVNSTGNRPGPPPPQQGRPPQARPPPPQQPYRPQPQQYRPPSSPHQHRPPPPQQQYRPSPPQQQYRPSPPRPTPTPPRASPRPSPAPAAKAPPPPVPTILSLVSLPRSYLNSLGIGTLKAILYENHVRVDFKQVLEKEELIKRVDELVRDERKRLERQRLDEEREAAGLNGDAKPPTPPVEGERATPEAGTKTVPTGPMPEVDRGLCVVCQDEEATLAVVDCGHLAMCAHCSDLIMATSQECPLCRTRIVTPQRLIRIYRT